MKKILCLAIVAMLVFLVGCQQPVAESEDLVEVPEEVEEVEEIEEVEEVEDVIEPVTEEVEMLSAASCSNGVIKVTVTNTREETINFSDTSKYYFFVNEVPDYEPQCDQQVLRLGESTICTGIDEFMLEKNHIRLMVDGDTSNLVQVTCSEETESIEE